MIDPAAILALLAFGPHSRAAIAIELSAPTDLVKRELWRLVHAGRVKRTGGTQSYALASYVAKNLRPAVPNQQRRLPVSGQPYRLCASCHLKHAKHSGLCRACARAAGLYTLTSFEADRERASAATCGIQPRRRYHEILITGSRRPVRLAATSSTASSIRWWTTKPCGNGTPSAGRVTGPR